MGHLFDVPSHCFKCSVGYPTVFTSFNPVYVLYMGLLLLLLLLFIVYLPLVSLMFHLNVSNALQGLVETFEMDASVGFAVH